MKSKLNEEVKNINHEYIKNGLKDLNIFDKSFLYSLIYNNENPCISFISININFIFDLYTLIKHIMKLKTSKDKKLNLINDIFNIITFINNELLISCESVINNHNIDYLEKLKNFINKLNEISFIKDNKLDFYINYLNDINKMYLNNNFDMKTIKELYDEIFNIIKSIILKSKTSQKI